MPERLNEDIAGRLEEVARLLAAQGANRFRVGAYERAAITIRRLSRPVSDILEQQGLEGLQALPGIGESIARAIRDLLERGRLAMLDRLRGESDPTKLLASVPGIGRQFADRLHHDLGIETVRLSPLPSALRSSGAETKCEPLFHDAHDDEHELQNQDDDDRQF
jgi:DNA polymerase/3'-5' exonuclease PolX